MFERIFNIINSGRIKTWYERYENHISSLALVFGFILDNLSLGRVDALADKLVLTIYLVLAGLCILLLTACEEGLIKESVPGRLHFWFMFAMQFALGGLFSAFVVFYTRSATFESSWPFLTLLFLYFLGNEIWKKYYSRLNVRLSVFFFALLSYATIVIPTIFNSIERWVFVVSTLIATIVYIVFVLIIRIVSEKRYELLKWRVRMSAIVVLGLLNLFYFLNIIPPLPLLLKDIGVYHDLKKKGDGGYFVEVEESSAWYDYFRSKKIFHRFAGEPIYVLTAVYSPVDLNTTVIHNWQKYNEETSSWIDQSNVVVPIKGGRQDGYRLYSLKQSAVPGLWRVNVVTEDNRLIGRIKFELVNVEEKAKTSPLIK